MKLVELIEQVIPFRHLGPVQQAELLAEMVEVEYPDATMIINQGDTDDRRVFLLLEGIVEVIEVIDAERLLSRKKHEIMPGHYFGERAGLFDVPREVSLRALGTVRCATMTGDHFLRLIHEYPAFAQAMGDMLRDKQGVFAPFEQFVAKLLHGVVERHLDFDDLVRRYRALRPALHAEVSSDNTIDFRALSYAVRRLPQNVTQTFMLFLADNLTVFYSDPESVFTAVPSAARRRVVYEMMPGKSMVLLRDGLSDLIDLVTCLCLYSVESHKIRGRLSGTETLVRVAAFLAEARAEDTLPFLETLPFNAEEALSLTRVWPENTVERIYEIAVHHEDFNIRITKQLDNYNSRHSEDWTNQIARATQQLLGLDPRSLPSEMPVHIVSSNTHSVGNCLSPYLFEHQEEIIEWGREHEPSVFAYDGFDSFDILYTLARPYMACHSEAASERVRLEREGGILRLGESAFTGIAVQLIDTALLRGRGLDANICFPDRCRDGLIVNIDYAFGQQSEEILANLLMLFGRNVASVNILGKAGALLGKRGDVLIADGFVEQTTDHLRVLPRAQPLNLDRLSRLLRGRSLHVGPVLTVAGTLLQNRVMLNLYRHIWRCIGLEMEGTYYLRQLLKAERLRTVRSDVDMRFLYYVSDLPLDQNATLSDRLQPQEGIPPLYAITREVLNGILETLVPDDPDPPPDSQGAQLPPAMD